MIKAKSIQNINRIREFLFYDPETGEIKWLQNRKGHTRKGMKAGAAHGRGYITIAFDGIEYLAHRLAWALHHGELATDVQVDHINGNRADNRLSNLRIATHAENCRNSKPRKHNKSGIKGVRRMGSKWAARIRVNSKEIWLGSHKTPEEAKAAYDEAASRYHGEFSKV
jgi:hypothetical protein